ncbi:MAG TPA: squalene/phytoene synthase family protein [Steroidobacteraceae bacterium]|jgi:phytoene synthase|nr:squalene/phytoene synthase family protein [Steroidobacteraceae bacterium]
MQRPDLAPTRSLAWLYSSALQRSVLAALSALECEIGASLRPRLDHQVAHTRLAWWREECARTAQGSPTHPLTRQLATLFAPLGPAPLSGLAGFVDTAVWDLSCATFDTRRELVGYCERWSAAMIAPLASLALPDAPAAQARALGASLREIELLLALAADARLGRLRIPLDELERAHLSLESLAQPPWPPTLAQLLRQRHRALRAALGAALEALPPAARPALRGLIVWATIACAASARAEKRLPQESTARDHHAPLDGWRAWRAARRVDTQRALARSD